MIKEVEGNLLTYTGIQVIGHQTNCLGVFGAGIAKQIKEMFPEVYKAYYYYCHGALKANCAKNILGSCMLCPAGDNKIVANLFGEFSYTESVAPFNEGDRPRHTDYNALKKALIKLKSQMKETVETNKLWGVEILKTVGVPYKIGCGLAGGNWDEVVYPMLKEIFEDDKDITLYIVKFNG